MEKSQKVYMVVKGKLVEEICTESPYTCKRHGSYHLARRSLGNIREEYVKNFFDTTVLPERERESKTAFQPPRYRRIGLIWRGEYFQKHADEALKVAQKLNDEERESVLYYTGVGHVDVLNHVYGRPRRIVERGKLADGTEKIKHVGDEHPDEEWAKIMQKHVDNVNKIIGLAGEQRQPEILYRAVVAHNRKGKFDRYANPAGGEDVEDFINSNFKAGGTFYRKTITSTSADPAAAVSFFMNEENRKDGHGVIIEYLTRQGARLSREAGTSTTIHNEHEVILPPYQKFKVVSVYKNVKYTIDARERFKDRGIKVNRFGNIVAPNITIVQVEEVD